MFGANDLLSDFCEKTQGALAYVGWVILIVKIAIPIIIFALGILDLGKAVVAAKEDDTKAAVKRLLWRLIAGIVIFFLPNLVLWVFSTVRGFSNHEDDFAKCRTCILKPSACNDDSDTYEK